GRLIIDLARVRQVQAASGDLSRAEVEAASPPPAHRQEFPRVDIPLPQPEAGIMSYRTRIAVLLVSALLIVLGSAAVGSRWWNTSVANPANANASANANVRAPSQSPEASPSPAAAGSPEPERQASKPSPRPRKKEKKSFLNKLKDIFR